ncbi:MAG: tellurite resistance TerB family protein [Hormoscilla sp. GUM202]|nr:tellurite resistance TerB family protein [Hormoscilla sp. GM7CHS1pb]MBO1350751.1 tellurite resistance TerB family protein [Hormoscilla sp. GUM202]
MSFMNWLNTQKKNLQEAVGRFKNKEFLEAVVAGCALVAAADGHIDPSEKQKMTGFIERSPELRVFDMREVLEKFNKYASDFEFNFDIGKRQALNAVVKIRENEEAAKLLVTVCCAIGAADGNFDDDEKNIIREMCKELTLSPAEFKL